MQARGSTALVSINAQVLDDLCRYKCIHCINMYRCMFMELIIIIDNIYHTSVLVIIYSRFLINLPEDEKKDPIKLFTHLELAHWFYLDLLRPEDHSLPACNFKEFIIANILYIFSGHFVISALRFYVDIVVQINACTHIHTQAHIRAGQ